MTLGDRIREMSDEELAVFLQWSVPDSCVDPITGDYRECFSGGCANTCNYNKRTGNMLEWIQSDEGVIEL